jgi:hypothetical protein
MIQSRESSIAPSEIPGAYPKRVQLKRSRGWLKPEGSIVVSRPSKLGNPWHFGPSTSRAAAVDSYRRWLRGEMGGHLSFERQKVLASLPEIRGRDLACWCPLEEPCHADVLLELANARAHH